MSDFPSILKARIEEKGLSAADASTAIGVSAPSLRGALAGKSFPNARSLDKYAAFLGLGGDETKALIEAAKGSDGAKAERKAGRKAGKPGRKPGRKAGSTGAKPGRKPGRKAGSTGSSAASALSTIAAALKQAESLAGDSLAVAVNQLGSKQRALIAGILKTIG